MYKYLFLFLFIQSCSPQMRLNRLLTKHPELAKVQTIEKEITIIEDDTVRIPEYKYDTTVTISDTISIDNQRFTIQIIKHDTIYKIKTVLKPFEVIQKDTIKYTYIDTINVFEYKNLTFKEKSQLRGQGMLIMLFIILLIIIIWQAIRLYLKGQLPFLNFLK